MSAALGQVRKELCAGDGLPAGGGTDGKGHSRLPSHVTLLKGHMHCCLLMWRNCIGFDSFLWFLILFIHSGSSAIPFFTSSQLSCLKPHIDSEYTICSSHPQIKNPIN